MTRYILSAPIQTTLVLFFQNFCLPITFVSISNISPCLYLFSYFYGLIL